MRSVLVKLFDRWWLPIYLLLATTWLFGPAIHHAGLGQLVFISEYEADGQPYGWVFRLGDALAAVTVALALLRSGVWRLNRPVTIAVLVALGLSFIDALFPQGCSTVCGTADRISILVHDIESTLYVIAIAVAAILAYKRQPRLITRLFLLFQIGIGTLLATRLLPYSGVALVQFIYQLSTIAWLAWFVRNLLPVQAISERAGWFVRAGFAYWAALSGVASIYNALPHHFNEAHVRVVTTLSQQPWLISHGVVAGLALLYVARQVARGQRRAALLLGVLLAGQVIRYALLQPHALLLALNGLSLVLLWVGISAFRRNIVPGALLLRLRPVFIMISGLALACMLLVLAASITGRSAVLFHAIDHAYDTRENHLTRIESHLRIFIDSAAAGVAGLTFYALFAAASGKRSQVAADDQSLVNDYLTQYGNSSEDYFKLWPTDKQYYFNNGFVAYKVVGSVAYALADPIGPDRPALLTNFKAYCQHHGWTVCFLLVQTSSKDLYDGAFRTYAIGSSALVSTETFATTTVRDKWWRWQMNRATKAGWTHEMRVAPHDAATIADIKAVSDAWLAHGNRREQGFALGYFDEDYMQQCRLHILRDASGAVLAFANELPVAAGAVQRTVDLIRYQPTENGAMPVLLAHLIKHLHDNADAAYFDLGFVPLAQLDSRLAQTVRRLAASRYSAAGLEQFKNKFKPEWQPNYVAYDGDILDLANVLGRLEKALEMPKNHKIDT